MNWRQRLQGARKLLPPGSAFVWLLAATSSFLLLLGLTGTVAAKALHMRWIRGLEAPNLVLVWTIAADIVVYLGLAAALALIEHRYPRARPATILVAAVLGALALGNAVYLTISGDQASRSAFEALFSRFGDVVAIFSHAATPEFAWTFAGGAVLAAGLHLVARRLARERPASGTGRAHAALILVFIGATLALVVPRPRNADARRLARNMFITVIQAFVGGTTTGTFKGYGSSKSAPALPASAEHKKRNVIVVILESTRYDHTSLVGPASPAATPHIARLADRGFSVPIMRAVITHTTKALFTMFCGRLPLFQRELWELSADIRPQCVPDSLRKIGYHTAFFQSAQGLFEQRARLVEKLGYEHFVPWEDIRGQRLGYLASDDETMLRPLRHWLDEIDAARHPFFATLLTSSPHHPYKLPSRVERALVDSGKPHDTDAERYARLVETEDELVGKLLDLLEFRSLRDNTIIIVIGDHGEGFGEYGSKQHDQNIYEEGVRVPFVAAGPGVSLRRPAGNANALDFAPTLLGLLDLGDEMPDAATFPGIDLTTNDVPADRPSWLSCWFADRCRGAVLDQVKVMVEPDTNEQFYFDLATDPREQDPKPLTPQLETLVEQMNAVFESQRISDREMVHEELRRYGHWWCPKDDDKCKHPGARHPDFRYEREESRRVAPRSSGEGKSRAPAP